MHIVIAPFRLNNGVSEDALVSASEDFQREFVRRQDGIVRRILVRDGDGGFADVVFFEDEEAIARVLEAEQSSAVCAGFFSLMDGDDTHKVYEVLQSYG